MRIFISYRRSDSSGHAGRLRDRLRKRFGRGVFQDVDDIVDGEDYERALDRAIARSRVGLVVIGPFWLHVTDEQGRRRIDQPDDPVRTEVRKMLDRDTLRVVPVLVGGAQMPLEALLPDDIKPLARRHARALRDSAWDADVAELIRQIQPFDPRLVGLTAAALVLACGATIAIGFAPTNESTGASGNQPELPVTTPPTDGRHASRPATPPSATVAEAKASADTPPPRGRRQLRRKPWPNGGPRWQPWALRRERQRRWKTLTAAAPRSSTTAGTFTRPQSNLPASR